MRLVGEHRADARPGDRAVAVRDWLVPAILGAALSAAMSYTTAAGMQERYFYVADLEYVAPWRARIFTNLLSGSVFSHAAWGAVFFGLVSLTYILHDRRAAPTLILGTFAVVQAAYALPDTMGMKAWDLPAVWIYAMICAALDRRRLRLLAAVAVLGVGFKETALLGAFAFLFIEGTPFRRKVLLCAGTIACGLAARAVIDAAVGNTPLFSLALMERNARGSFLEDPRRSHLAWNVAWLLIKAPHTLLLLNGGTLLVLFLLPGWVPHIAAWRTVGVIFVCGNMVFGRVSEPRVFLEMAPPAVWALHRWATGRRGACRAPAPIPEG